MSDTLICEICGAEVDNWLDENWSIGAIIGICNTQADPGGISGENGGRHEEQPERWNVH